MQKKKCSKLQNFKFEYASKIFRIVIGFHNRKFDVFFFDVKSHGYQHQLIKKFKIDALEHTLGFFLIQIFKIRKLKHLLSV